MKYFSVYLLSISAISLTACSSLPGKATAQKEKITEQSQIGVDTTVEETKGGLGEAVMTPLSDLNLRRKKIPYVLTKLKTPYDPIAKITCQGLTSEVRGLDNVLGDDADAYVSDESVGEKSGKVASKFTLGAVSSATGSLIPMRGIVRYATGAQQHADKLAAAYSTGIARRAYLKGIGIQKGCKHPAAPRLTSNG